MRKIDKAIVLAKDNLNKSVMEINPNILEEVKEKDEEYLTFGVKNTGDIPRRLIDNIRSNKKFLWTTIDRMSHLGRSIDTELINPLTYRAMTGSSSGTAINVFKGINDFGIGTDGGGSVLAPALSLNLFSFLGKGAGLEISKKGVSTDNIAFKPGIGLISKDFSTLKYVVNELMSLEESSLEEMRVVIPEKNTCKTVEGEDTYNKVINILNKIKNYHKLTIVEYRFQDIYNRESSIKDINNIFSNDIGDIIINFEGPIDLYGYDETIQKSFLGNGAKEITKNGGKALVKSANICRCSAITLPVNEIASGIVLCSKEGKEKIHGLFALAEEINEVIKRPDIYEKYFIRKEKFVNSLDF
ncbi:MAG: amidase [Clostridium paraputrificum]